MNQPIKQLIKKFAANNCSPQEVEVLVAYFKNAEIDHEFPEVETVLAVLNEFPELNKDDAAKIYEEILRKARAEENTISLTAKNKSIFRKYAGWAAVFVGLIGGLVYFGLMKYNRESIASSLIKKNTITLETQNGKVRMLTANGQLQLTDSKGEIVGGQQGNQLVYHNNKKDKNPKEIEYNTLHIPYGKRFEIELADGSKVFMNSGSSLKYPINFPKNGKRKVFLSGEAFFKVSKDKNRPFVVEAENLEVGVLGTKFNVSAYPEDSATSVVLVEGSVKLGTKGNKAETAVLTPGQLAKSERLENTLTIQKVDTNLYTAWMHGGLVFRNKSFKNILKKMERHYAVTIINKEPELANEKFNASFGQESLEKILEYFKETYGLNFRRKNKNIFIINPKAKK